MDVRKLQHISVAPFLRKPVTLALIATVGAVLSGCARSTVNTTIRADGSWTRMVTYRAPAPDDKGFSLSPKLEEVFGMPSGGPWKTKREKVEDEIVYTAERQLGAGETQRQDLTVKGDKNGQKVPIMLNEATVKEIAPGRFEYRETLRWQGPLPKDLTEPDPEMTQAIKNMLPPALATSANVRELEQAMGRQFGMVLFGPPDPLLSHLFSEMLMHPDLTERRIARRMGAPIRKALETKFGDKLSEEQRTAIARNLVASIFKTAKTKIKSQTKPDAAAKAGGPGGSDSGALVALTFSVKMPGKIVSSNGEVDELTNEVYWGAYPEAAALGDVVLTATCELPQKTAAK